MVCSLGMVEHRRVALIGLDGVGWSILDRFVREFELSNFDRMIRCGARGKLRSTLPPVTGPAWLAIATGLSPGETGVIDFFKLSSYYSLSSVGVADFRGRSIWDFLSVMNYKVGVIDYPLLYPAYSVNGFMVASWGGRVSLYPSDLFNGLGLDPSEYNIRVPYNHVRYDDVYRFLDDIDRALNMKLSVSKGLLKSREWDLFVDVISITDWLQHRLWHVIDVSHPLHPSGSDTEYILDRIGGCWKLIDEYLGEVMEVADDVIVVSDHGFGPHWGIFNLGRWLYDKGFVVLRKRSVSERVRGSLVRIMLSSFFLRRLLKKILPRRLVSSGRDVMLRYSEPSTYIDVEKSPVVVLGHTIPFGAIYLNRNFIDKYDEILKRIEYMLMNVRFDLNKEVDISIYRPKLIYKGRRVDKLPDIIISVNGWRSVVINDFYNDSIYIDDVFSPRLTGSHRLFGVFIAWGSDIRRDLDIGDVALYDIAPTIMHVVGLPIPSNFFGRVLTEVFDNSSEVRGREPVIVNPLYYRTRLLRRDMEAMVKRRPG